MFSVFCSLIFVLIGLFIVKLLKLVIKSKKPVILIRDEKLRFLGMTNQEFHFSEIRSIKLAQSGFQFLGQSLLIFLNSDSETDQTDRQIISIPLLFVKGNREHLLRVINLHLSRYKLIRETEENVTFD
jgi:hypothetical protein